MIVGWLVAWVLRGSVRSSDAVGTTYGILAVSWLTLVAAYGVRRRMMRAVTRLGLGRARTWLRLHLYGGLLFLLAVILHAGLGWPAGLMSWALWLLSLWTVLSGFFGLALQRTVPRLLSSSSSLEVNYDRIPELVDEIRQRAESLVAAAEAPVRGLYARSLAPVLAAPRRNLSVLLDSGSWMHHMESVRRLQTLLPGDQRDQIEELERLVRAKLDLDTHYTLQQLLRGWLWLHLPASILLCALVLLHIATVMYY
jgi:hypothetical protein